MRERAKPYLEAKEKEKDAYVSYQSLMHIYHGTFYYQVEGEGTRQL